MLTHMTGPAIRADLAWVDLAVLAELACRPREGGGECGGGGGGGAGGPG